MFVCLKTCAPSFLTNTHENGNCRRNKHKNGQIYIYIYIYAKGASWYLRFHALPRSLIILLAKVAPLLLAISLFVLSVNINEIANYIANVSTNNIDNEIANNMLTERFHEQYN